MNFGAVRFAFDGVPEWGAGITATRNFLAVTFEAPERAAVWALVSLCTAWVTLICALLAFAGIGARTPIARLAAMAATGILMLFFILLIFLMAGPCLPCRCPVEPVLLAHR